MEDTINEHADAPYTYKHTGNIQQLNHKNIQLQETLQICILYLSSESD